MYEKKYKNGTKMRFTHKHAGIFVASGLFSGMRVLWASEHLVTSGHFSDKR